MIFLRIIKKKWNLYSGTSYKLGDNVKVKIQKCDIEKRLIELSFDTTL